MKDQQAAEPLTSKECAELVGIMGIKYGANLRGRFFELQVHSDTQTAHVTLTLRNEDSTYYYPVEGRIEHQSQDLSPQEGVLVLVDYIDSYFAEFLREDEGIYLPIDWKDFHWEGVDMQLKGQILNRKYETLADEILAGGQTQQAVDAAP